MTAYVCFIHVCTYKYACLLERTDVWWVCLCCAFVCVGCTCSTLQKVLYIADYEPSICALPIANPAPTPLPTYRIANHSIYVIDKSSVGHPLFGHVPTYAPVWRRPYHWMNVGNLFPGVNKKPPPTKFDVRRKAVTGLCTWCTLPRCSEEQHLVKFVKTRAPWPCHVLRILVS